MTKKFTTSVKSVLARPEGPTVQTYHWSRLPGKLVKKLTGEPAGKYPIDDPLQWNLTLNEVITDQANNIHRKSLIQGANFIVVGLLGQVLVESALTYKPFLDDQKTLDKDLDISFEDAKPIGILNNRLFVLRSESMPENQILVGLGGRGVEAIIGKGPKDDDVPMITFEKTDEPYAQVGQVEYWGLVKILDAGSIE